MATWPAFLWQSYMKDVFAHAAVRGGRCSSPPRANVGNKPSPTATAAPTETVAPTEEPTEEAPRRSPSRRVSRASSRRDATAAVVNAGLSPNVVVGVVRHRDRPVGSSGSTRRAARMLAGRRVGDARRLHRPEARRRRRSRRRRPPRADAGADTLIPARGGRPPLAGASRSRPSTADFGGGSGPGSLGIAVPSVARRHGRIVRGQRRTHPPATDRPWPRDQRRWV